MMSHAASFSRIPGGIVSTNRESSGGRGSPPARRLFILSIFRASSSDALRSSKSGRPPQLLGEIHEYGVELPREPLRLLTVKSLLIHWHLSQLHRSHQSFRTHSIPKYVASLSALSSLSDCFPATKRLSDACSTPVARSTARNELHRFNASRNSSVIVAGG